MALNTTEKCLLEFVCIASNATLGTIRALAQQAVGIIQAQIVAYEAYLVVLDTLAFPATLALQGLSLVRAEIDKVAAFLPPELLKGCPALIEVRQLLDGTVRIVFSDVPDLIREIESQLRFSNQVRLIVARLNQMVADLTALIAVIDDRICPET